jgi:type IV secretory pathway VirD2 relaxase
MPPPMKNGFMMEMKITKALQPEQKYIESQQYSEKLNNRVHTKHVHTLEMKRMTGFFCKTLVYGNSWTRMKLSSATVP